MFIIIVLATLALFLFVYATKWLNSKRRDDKLVAMVDGPDNYPVTESVDLTSPEEVWLYYRELGLKYYPIYKSWIGMTPIINLVVPEDIEAVLGGKRHLTKGCMYDSLRSCIGQGILTCGGDGKWHYKRRILTPFFQSDVLKQYMTLFSEESNRLVEQLEETSNQPYIDIVPLVTNLSLNTIFEMVMGTQLERKNENVQEYTRSLSKMGELLQSRILTPWYSYIFSSKYREQQKNSLVVHKYTDSIIKKSNTSFKESINSQNRPTKDCLSMLGVLLSARASGELLNDIVMREDVEATIFKGHEALASSVSFILMLLANHSEIQEKVVQELQKVSGNSNRSPTIEELNKLPYFEQVLKECLRLYPPVPTISRILDEQITIHSGYTFPSGTTIHIHIYDMHHCGYYYSEPEKFDPDRFSEENSSKRLPFSFIPFGAGPRNCIAQDFAMLEIKTVVSSILRKFAVKPVDTPSDITLINHYVLKSKNGIKIRLQKRHK